MLNWNAEQYSKFETERTLPASDLAVAIKHDNVRTAIDIGCGIGNSTRVLCERFKDAVIVGADNSEDMLKAAKKNNPELKFIMLDAENETENIKERYDVVFSNACIQWISNHKKLLRDMFSLLNDGGVLAVQIPLQSKHPVHKVMQAMAASDRWSGILSSGRRYNNLTEGEYFDLLSELTNDFRIWETTYYYIMPSYESIAEWYKGTGMRPYLKQLPEEDRGEYIEDFVKRIKEIYSVQKNGSIILKYPRLFFTAKKV